VASVLRRCVRVVRCRGDRGADLREAEVGLRAGARTGVLPRASRPIKSQPSWPAFHDDVAPRVLTAMRSLGLLAPGDLAVIGFAERFVADADDLGIRGTMRDGTSVALREVIVHMIEEYARHAGHADLLRERIDGRVGQLSPGGATPRTPRLSVRPSLIAKRRRSYQARPHGQRLCRVSALASIRYPRGTPAPATSAHAGLIAKTAIVSGPQARTKAAQSLSLDVNPRRSRGRGGSARPRASSRG
jgi:hypothetical protein